MSKISERRERTANTNIENKAVLADAPAKKKEFPYKKLLVAVLAIVAIIACALLIINVIINNKLATLTNNGELVAVEDATVPENFVAEGVIYENTAGLMDSKGFKNAYLAAVANHKDNYTNINSVDGIYNYIMLITDDNNAENPENNLADDSKGLIVAVMLSLNANESKVTYVTINKSSMAVIPEVGVGPLYDAYAFGGSALFAKSVQDNYGIKVNGYAELTISTFFSAAENLGGIEIDGEKLEDKQALYDYVKDAEINGSTREAATKNVVKTLAAGVADAGVFGLNKLMEAANLKAYLTRDDLGDLITAGVKMFKSEATVTDLGYDTAKQVWVKDDPSYMCSTFDYEAEIDALLITLGYKAAPVVEDTNPPAQGEGATGEAA
ncbi:MAG: LCP family protein [Clostridia bacterium]|nr:LCP family protein [Clostridia bacterium]